MGDDVASPAQEEASIATRRFDALHGLSQLVAEAARRDAAMARLEAALRSLADAAGARSDRRVAQPQ
jgi:hypothetical protein